MAGSTESGVVFDHRHSVGTTAIVVGATVLLSLYASWAVADVLPRLLSFALAAVVVGFVLYGRSSRMAVVAWSLYTLAALLVLTPVFLQLTYVVHAGLVADGGALTFVQPIDLLFALLFVVLAAIPAAIGFYILHRKAIKERVRGALRRGRGLVSG